MKNTFTAILLLLLASCGPIITNQESENSEQEKRTEWKTLDESNYSIQYPSTWELNQSGEMGTSFFLFSPLESNADKFKENVNLLIQDLSGQNLDLNKYTEISEEQIKTLALNAILIESKRVENSNDEFHKLIYTCDQGGFHLKIEQKYWVINEKAYVLTFTCEADKAKLFSDKAENILSSFKLK
jgi:hypothetical protein